MKAIVHPSFVSGVVQAPPSKSMMQRACALALTRWGITEIYNPGTSADDTVAINIIQRLGALVEQRADHLYIDSRNFLSCPVASEINCGESGLSLRMFVPIAALTGQEITFSGKGSILNRSMQFLEKVLPTLGVEVISNNGKLPITIKGRLQPRDITIDGSLSSQYLTGLLIAYAADNTEKKTITVSGLNSKPYIDMTLQMLRQSGRYIHNAAYETFTIDPTTFAPPTEATASWMIEGDWSGASFLLVAGAINGAVSVKGLRMDSLQADSRIVTALKAAGARVEPIVDVLKVTSDKLAAFEFDATDCPDLFPPLVAMAVNCQGVTSLAGVHRLKHKESDRELSLVTEFTKLGAEIEVIGDTMYVTGGNKLGGNERLDSHSDHRIAMACAVAAISAGGTCTINNAGAVNKSYPLFWDDLQQIGVSVTLEEHSA